MPRNWPPKKTAITTNCGTNWMFFCANNDDGYRQVTTRRRNEPEYLFDASHGGVISIINSVPPVSPNGQRNGNEKKSSRKSLGKRR